MVYRCESQDIAVLCRIVRTLSLLKQAPRQTSENATALCPPSYDRGRDPTGWQPEKINPDPSWGVRRIILRFFDLYRRHPAVLRVAWHRTPGLLV
jgi:hypothetical protein